MARPIPLTTDRQSPRTLTSFLYLTPKGQVDFSLYLPQKICYGLFTDLEFVALVRGLDTGEGSQFNSGRNLLLTPFGCGVLTDWIEENADRLLTSADTVHPLTAADLFQWATDLRLRFQTDQNPPYS